MSAKRRGIGVSAFVLMAVPVVIIFNFITYIQNNYYPKLTSPNLIQVIEQGYGNLLYFGLRILFGFLFFLLAVGLLMRKEIMRRSTIVMMILVALRQVFDFSNIMIYGFQQNHNLSSVGIHAFEFMFRIGVPALLIFYLTRFGVKSEFTK